ncbi:glycosyltransferase [Natronocella acetinitrilica]|uniref:glycosyltransferase n=1 Tax=Natronocella acetinitrilica TaxID=414046 RepID=UPI00209F8E4E
MLTPAHNRAAFIDRTVKGVLSQTYGSVEYIIVDDGSTDGTLQLLQSYEGHGTISLLQHPNGENRGQSASLNLALSVARGEYIAILDSDDMFHPRKLEILVDYLERHPDVGLAYSNGYAVDENDNVLYEMHPPDHQEENDPNRLLMDCYFLLPQNAVVRQSVFDAAGRFEESFRSAQDHDMLLRIVEKTKIAYVPEHLFYYRRHGDSISAKRQDLRWKTGFEILRRAAKRYPYRRSTIRKRRAVLHFRMGQVHWRAGERGKALPHFLMAGALDPLRGFSVLTGREQVR